MSSVFVSARFPQELVSEAQQRAELEDRSLSSVIRLAVQRYIADDAEQHPPHPHTTPRRAA